MLQSYLVAALDTQSERCGLYRSLLEDTYWTTVSSVMLCHVMSCLMHLVSSTTFVMRFDAMQVQGKVNAITLDSCSRTGLVFQDLVSSCEVVNCSSVEVQSTGIMPTIAIDKTDGIVVSPRPTWVCCPLASCMHFTWCSSARCFCCLHISFAAFVIRPQPHQSLSGQRLEVSLGPCALGLPFLLSQVSLGTTVCIYS